PPATVVGGAVYADRDRLDRRDAGRILVVSRHPDVARAARLRPVDPVAGRPVQIVVASLLGQTRARVAGGERKKLQREHRADSGNAGDSRTAEVTASNQSRGPCDSGVTFEGESESPSSTDTPSTPPALPAPVGIAGGTQISPITTIDRGERPSHDFNRLQGSRANCVGLEVEAPAVRVEVRLRAMTLGANWA